MINFLIRKIFTLAFSVMLFCASLPALADEGDLSTYEPASGDAAGPPLVFDCPSLIFAGADEGKPFRKILQPETVAQDDLLPHQLPLTSSGEPPIKKFRLAYTTPDGVTVASENGGLMVYATFPLKPQ